MSSEPLKIHHILAAAPQISCRSYRLLPSSAAFRVLTLSEEEKRWAVLAKSTISELMAALMLQGLVDIGPDAWGVSYRIG